MPKLRQSANAPAERELTQAVRRVYEHFGTDLNSFFRHVQEQTGGSTEKPEKSAGSEAQADSVDKPST